MRIGDTSRYFRRCLSPLLLQSELTSRIQGRRGSYQQGDGRVPSVITDCLKSNGGSGGVLNAHFLFEHNGNIGKSGRGRLFRKAEYVSTDTFMCKHS